LAEAADVSFAVQRPWCEEGRLWLCLSSGFLSQLLGMMWSENKLQMVKQRHFPLFPMRNPALSIPKNHGA
jgi:hypothetical protein